MKKHLLTGLSAACLVLAAVFKFALIGYTTLALCSLALAAVFAFYRLTALGVPAETAKPVLRLNYFIREGFAMLYYLCFNNV